MNTPTQEQVFELVDSRIASSERLLIVWFGAIRSGKTFGACKAMLRHSLGRSGAIYILGAYTQRQVWINLAPVLKAECEAMDITYSEFRSPSNPHIVIGDNVWLVTGGKDGLRSKSIQGITASGLLLDELPNLDKDFIHQCEARTSAKGAIRIYTANKGNPFHWTNRYYYERLKKGEIDGFLFESVTSENSHIDDAFIQERNKEYDASTRMMFMDNQFVAPTPLYNARMADCVSDECLITAIGTDGKDYVELGLNRHHDNWVVTERQGGRCPIAEIKGDNTVILPDTLQLLGRQMRRGRRRVKVYQTAPQKWRTETTQTILSQHCYIDSKAYGLIDALSQYSSVRTKDEKYIPALDALAQYVRGMI